MSARAAWPVAALVLAGCDLSMTQQPKRTAQGPATLWPGGPPQQAAPEGTLAVDSPAAASALASPPPLTRALMARGAERYAIFCAPCHGPRGEGDGTIVRRGFPAPPSFHAARLLAAPPAYVVDVVTNGHGAMYSYADRIAPADRWAVAAWVKALQQVPAR